MSLFSLERVVAELNTQIDNAIIIDTYPPEEENDQPLEKLEDVITRLIQTTWIKILTALKTYPGGAVELATLNLFARDETKHESLSVYRSEIALPAEPDGHAAVKERAPESDITLRSDQTVPDMVEQIAKVIYQHKDSFDGLLIEPKLRKKN